MTKIEKNQNDRTPLSRVEGKYLTFWSENQLFGVPIVDVVQIVGVQKIISIPKFPDYAKGVINLRNEIIPVIDIRLRLKREEAEYDDRTCIIITRIKESSVGLIVDQVDEVLDIPENAIAPPPKVGGSSSAYLTGIGTMSDKVVLLMKTSKLIGHEDLELISQNASDLSSIASG